MVKLGRYGKFVISTYILFVREFVVKVFLYKIIECISKLHSFFLSLNDEFEYNFSDKELHFLIIGLLGMGFIFAIYPVFKWLAKRNCVMTITWIYVFTLIIVITFAIEIGQKVSGSGSMDFADIVFGLSGFICMYIAFSILRGIWHWICNRIRRRF